MKRELKRTWSKISAKLRVLKKLDKPVVTISLTVLAALVTLIFHVRYSSYPFDDALIHMRIARNIAEFGVPYFNVGEKVMGSSPHLWINGVALLFLCFGPNPVWAAVFSYVLFLGGVAVFSAILHNEGVKRHIAPFLSLILLSAFSLYSVSGLMETALVSLLLGAAVLAMQTHDGFWGGFFSTLVIWGRYEFVFVSLFAFLLSKKKKEFIVGGAIPSTLFLAYCLFYFGTFVPQPVRAKPIVYEGTGGTNYKFFSKPLLISLFTGHRVARVLDALIVMGSILALSVFGTKRVAERILLTLGATITLVYIFQKPLMFPWYQPNVYVPLGLGLVLFGIRSYREGKTKLVWLTVALFYNTVYAPMNGFFKAVEGAFTGEIQKNAQILSNFRVQDYLSIGARLSSEAGDQVLLTSEIGGLGWAYPGPIRDGIALVSPEALKYHPLKTRDGMRKPEAGSIPLGYLEEVKPHWVVSMPTFMQEIAPYLDDPKGPYKLYFEVPMFSSVKVPARAVLARNLWGSSSVKVYVRKPISTLAK